MAMAMAPFSAPTLHLGAALLLLLSCCLPFPSALSSSSASGVRKPYREFDYFSLSLQWPGTICRTTRHCCSSNGCCDSSVPLSEFTIHGLWPDYNDGSWPACCSKTSFDINKVSSLMGELKKYWPSLSCSSSSLCFGGKGLFWAHEWEKHGTCSFPVITDEYDYFSTVLDLYLEYNMTKILDDAGFVASNAEEYPLRDVVTAVENAVGTSPLLVCSHGSVEELRICFDKNLKPRDCLLASNRQYGTLHSSSSCPKYISLPKYTRIAKGENSTITWLADDENSQAITEFPPFQFIS